MVYKKYIVRGGKKFGPYYFKSVRTPDGKVKSVYLGTENPSKKNFSFFTLFFAVALLAIFGVLGLFAYQGFNVAEISDVASGLEEVVDSSGGGQLEEPIEEEVKEEKIPDDIDEEEVVKEESHEEEIIEEPSLDDSDDEIVINETEVDLNETEEEINVSIEINETEIDLNETESNITLEINQTNDSITNQSILKPNKTLIHSVAGETGYNLSLSHYDVVINQPVKWQKKISFEKEVGKAELKIPLEAENITIVKTGENVVEKEIEPNLVTGNFFLNLLTGLAILEKPKEQTIKIDGPLKEAIVEYYMPGPTSKEVDLESDGRRIIVSGKNLSNVLAYTKFNKSISGGVSLYLIDNESKESLNFISKDLDDNGKIDYIEWIIPVLDGEKEFEVEIIILNVQSYPELKGNWTVRFNTTGTADLKIAPFNITTWDIEEIEGKDLQFLNLMCGNESVDYEWINNSVFVSDYNCNETGIEVSKVLTDAKHYLKFEFGGQIGYAYNDVLSCGQSVSGNVVMENDLTDCTGNGLDVAAGATLDCDGHTIDGDGGSDNDHGIWVAWNRNGVTIKNCHITQFDRGAYNDGDNNLWLNNTFDAIQDYGLKVQNSNNVSVLNSTFKDYANIGIEYKGVIGGVIDNNTCYNLTGSRCINFPSSGTADRNHYINITNNNLSASGYGAYLYYGRNSLFKNNLVFDNTVMGLYMNYAGNLTIIDNHIYTTDGSQDHGIYITAGETDNNTIANNTFENHTNQWPSAGIRVSTADFSNNVIDNNTFIGNEAGILFYPAGSWNNITNNYFDGINYQAIYFYGTGGAPNNRIIGNVVESNTGGSGDHDYYIRDSENVTMINNTANDCGSYCIYLYQSDGGVIENFYGAGSSSYALYVYKSDNINLTNITMDTESSAAYIYGPRNSHFTNLTLNGSSTYGLLAYHNDNNTYRNITSIHSSYGLRWYNLSNNLFVNSLFSGSTNDYYFDGGERDKNTTFLNVSSGTANWVNSMAILDIKWFLDVQTKLITDGSLLENSVIQIYNNTGTSEADLVLNLTSNGDGVIPKQNFTQHLINRTTGNYSYKTNYTIVVNHSEYDGKSQEVNLTSDKFVLFELGTVNTPPSAFSNIVLNSSSNTNATDENLTVFFDTNADDDGDQVFNISDWRKNETSIAVVNMPFDKEVTENNGTIRDFSTYENNGTLGNDTAGNQPVWRNGTDCKIGGCYHFDGGADFDYDNDFIQLYEDFDLTNGGTIMGWMKFDNLDKDQALINLANTSQEELVIWMDEFGENDRFGMAIYDSAWHGGYGASVVDTTSWWHVAFVYNAGKPPFYGRLYVNGVQEGTDLEYDLRDVAGSSWRIGLGDQGGKAMNGTIDQFKIFNISLSPEQIYSIYTDEFNNHSVQTIVHNETDVGENWTVALTPSDLQDYGTTTLSNSLVVLEIPSTNPTTPTPLLNSTDGTSSLDVNLNCSATITDPNLEKMNVTVRWYRGDAYVLEENFTNSFASGTLFNASLDSGNTSEGDSWHCAMRLNNSISGSEWGNSSEFTIKEFNNTYYVSKQGSDSNVGTSFKDAWKTINYAENTAGANAIIHVGDGLYREQSYATSYLLILDKNVQNRTFNSYNKSQAIIQANTSASSIVVRFITGANNVTFKNFVVDGNNTENGIWGDQGTGMIKLYNNTFVNMTSYGISLYDFGGSSGPRHNWWIEGNSFNNSGSGIYGYASSNVTIKNNNFTYKLSNTGIRFLSPDSNNTLIQGNYFENSSQAGMELNNMGSNCQIKDNIFGSPNDYMHNYGIRFNNSQNLLIQNNTFWYGNFSANWVSIYGEKNNNNGLKIIGNRWGNDTSFLNLSMGTSNGYAINVINVSNSLFANNSMYIIDGTPLYIRGNGNGPNKNITIRNNTIDHDITAESIPGGYSIYVGEDTVPNFEGDINDTLIENNIIRMASVPTSRHPLFTAKTYNTTIRYNHVIGGGYGILSKHETWYTAYNNTMENQTNFEGFVTRAGHNVTVYNNTFLCPYYNKTTSPIAIVAKNAKYSNPRNVTNFQAYNNRYYLYNNSYTYAFYENGTNFSNTNFSSYDNIIILNNSNQYVAWENSEVDKYNFTEFQKLYSLETDSIFSANDEIPWVLNLSNRTGFTNVTLNWTSQESANASINYGNTVSLGTTYRNTSLTLFHTFNITGLSQGTMYYYNITMCDYDENCNETGTYNFTTDVDDIAPNVSNVTMTPTNPRSFQSLNCSFNVSDEDVGDTLTAEVRWFNNSVKVYAENVSVTADVINSTIFNFTNTSVGEDWWCGVVPYDETLFGTEVNSTNETVTNVAACGDIIYRAGDYIVNATESNYGAGIGTGWKCIQINVSDVELNGQNLQLDAECCPFPSTKGDGIWVSGVSGGRIENITLYNLDLQQFGQAQVYFGYVENSTLYNYTLDSPCAQFGGTNVNVRIEAGSENIIITNGTTLATSLHGYHLDGISENLTFDSANYTGGGNAYFVGAKVKDSIVRDSRLLGDSLAGGGAYLSSLTDYGNFTFHNVSMSDFENAVYINYGLNGTFTNCTIENNSIGIDLHSSINPYGRDFTFISNRIQNNSMAGINVTLAESSNNTFYNNYINNTVNVVIRSGTYNNWNRTSLTGKSIVGTDNLGGNYWATPAGDGWSQTCVDTDDDGFCQNAYVMDENNTDYLPLTLRSNEAPVYSNNRTNYTVAGRAIDHLLDWVDDIGLDGYIFSIKMNEMEDDFNDNSLDLNKWVESTAAQSYVAEENQQLNISSAASWSAFVFTNDTYKIQNKSIMVKVERQSTDGGFKITPTYGNGAHWPQWDIYEEATYYNYQLYTGNTVRIMKKSGSTTYPATSSGLATPFWLRMRINDTTIFFDYANNTDAIPSASNWTNLHSEAWGLATAITADYHFFLTSYNTPTTGESIMDNFEITSNPEGNYFINDTWTAWPGDPTTNLSNVSKTVPSKLGSTIRWRVYANDTADVWNTSDIYTYLTTADRPIISNITLVSDDTTNYSDENLTVSFDLSNFTGAESAYNLTDWRINGTSVAFVNMPFDRNVSESNGTILDISTYGNNGTLGNGTAGTEPTWKGPNDCLVGGCYHFDGGADFEPDNEFIQLYEDFDLTNGGTIMGWMKMNNLDKDHQLVGIALTGGEELSIWMDENGEDDRFAIAVYNEPGPTWWAEYGTTVPDTTSWWHVAFTYSTDNGEFGRLYINGTQEGEDHPNDLRNIEGSSWRIGLGDNGGKAMNGSIDEFKIINRTLSSDEIREEYLAGLAGHSVQKIVSNETSRWDNWSVSMVFSDLEKYWSPVLSNFLSIRNKPPGQPVLDSPADENTTQDRTEKLNWSEPADLEGDSLTYLVEVDDDSEFGSPVLINVSPATNEYSIATDLDLDTTFWWRARANDSYDLGIWSEIYNFTVESYLGVSLINESPTFSVLYNGQSDNTTDESPPPIVVQNDGNALINVSVNATTLFDSAAMGTEYYKFRIDNSSEKTAFEWLTSFISWTNMATAQVIAIDSLKYQDTNDTAQCEILVTIPPEESPGNKTSSVLFESSLAE